MNAKRTIFFPTEEVNGMDEFLQFSKERLAEISAKLVEAVEKGIKAETIKSPGDLFKIASDIAETDMELVFIVYKLGGVEEDIIMAIHVKKHSEQSEEKEIDG